MATFAYRAVNRVGQTDSGEVQARDHSEAVERVRSLGIVPVEVKERPARRELAPKLRGSSRTRTETTKALGELGVLLNAGLPLDRALALSLENIEQPE